MNIRWVVLFAAVAEEGSFTRAATRLNIAQPWVSAQIRKLEFELDVKLLERTKAGVELTPEGRQLLPFARQVAEGTRQFRDLARTMGDVRAKLVRIGSHAPMVDIAAIRQINNEFARRYPQFLLRAESGSTPELLSELRRGQIDYAFCLSPIDDEDDEFEAVPLGAVEPFLLLPRGTALDLDDLAGTTIGAPSAELHPVFYEALLTPLRAAGATIRAVPEADRRAIEHHARTRNVPVVMIEGDEAAYADDKDLTTQTLPAIGSEHRLIRVAEREYGRAATRYWTIAEAAASPSVPAPAPSFAPAAREFMETLP